MRFASEWSDGTRIHRFVTQRTDVRCRTLDIAKGTKAEAYGNAGSNVDKYRGPPSNGKYLKIQFIHFSCVPSFSWNVSFASVWFVQIYLQFARMNPITTSNVDAKQNNNTHKTPIYTERLQCRREWMLVYDHQPSPCHRARACVPCRLCVQLRASRISIWSCFEDISKRTERHRHFVDEIGAKLWDTRHHRSTPILAKRMLHTRICVHDARINLRSQK